MKPKVTVQSRSDTLIKEEKIVVAMLSRQTLVLNRNWQPVGVASVARSLTLVAAERARIVDPAGQNGDELGVEHGYCLRPIARS